MASRHVFLSYNKEDEAAVREIADRLKGECDPWMDDDLTPGRSWQEEVEEVIRTCRAAAVFVGQSGLGPWERLEAKALLSQVVKRGIPVIPVLLPEAPAKPELPLLLEELSWVELQDGITQEGIDRIVRGITSRKRRRRSGKAPEPTPAVPLTPEDRLLDRVKRDWVRGLLDEKVPASRRIDLKMEQRPGEVEHLKEAVDEAPSVLSEGELLSLFRDHGCSLLILGDTGSGKTTALLLLARDLILARRSPDEPIPVYLPLSSWSKRRLPLGEWLAEAMGDFYQAKELAQRSWLPQHRILPLLDGLDEVEAESQAACVKAINDWLTDHGIYGMAVCCHSRVYEQMPERLKLATAVVLQPITEEQITQYAAAIGPDGETLRAALAGDKGLRELAKTPQLLHLIEEDCRDDEASKARAGVAGAPLEDRRRRLFGRYVDRRLQGSPSSLYPRELSLSWLAWLAGRMKEHGTPLFQLEQLQPIWLPRPVERWAYFLGSRALAGLLLILPLAFLRPSLILFGLAALLLGLVLGVRSAERKGGRDIRTAEVLAWTWGSWKGALRGASAGVFLGAVSWLTLWLGKNSAPVPQALQFTGLLALAGATIGTLLGGVQVGTIPKKSLPNLGMWLTLKRAALLFLVVFLGISFMFGAVVLGLHRMWPEFRYSLPLWSPLLLGALFGFWTGLAFGGLDFLQHFVLRALLRLRGYAPFRYVEFLDHAADIGLLYRAGGSYFFYYQPLLEHFAALRAEAPEA